MGSEPAVQGSVAAGVVPLALRYNSRVDHGRSSLVLTRPDRSTERLPIAAGSAVDALDSTATLAPGSYSLRWQVLATDGHITRGDVPFAVVAPGAAAGAAPVAAAGGVPAAVTASAGAADTAGTSGVVPARVAAAPATPGH